MSNIKFYGIRFLENLSPMLYSKIGYIYLKIFKQNSDRIVSKNSNICIEGFPRSANSYAARVFEHNSENPIKIATHMHSHANVIRALNLEVPTLVLIRRPLDAIVSLKALQLETAYLNNKLNVSFPDDSHYINWYISFYSSLLNRRDEFIIGKFEDVISDINIIIDKFNSKYSYNIKTYENMENVLKKSKKNFKHHIFPTEKRNNLKKSVELNLDDKKIEKLLIQANELYDKFIS